MLTGFFCLSQALWWPGRCEHEQNKAKCSSECSFEEGSLRPVVSTFSLQPAWEVCDHVSSSVRRLSGLHSVFAEDEVCDDLLSCSSPCDLKACDRTNCSWMLNMSEDQLSLWSCWHCSDESLNALQWSNTSVMFEMDEEEGLRDEEEILLQKKDGGHKLLIRYKHKVRSCFKSAQVDAVWSRHTQQRGECFWSQTSVISLYDVWYWSETLDINYLPIQSLIRYIQYIYLNVDWICIWHIKTNSLMWDTWCFKSVLILNCLVDQLKLLTWKFTWKMRSVREETEVDSSPQIRTQAAGPVWFLWKLIYHKE